MEWSSSIINLSLTNLNVNSISVPCDSLFMTLIHNKESLQKLLFSSEGKVSLFPHTSVFLNFTYNEEVALNFSV